MTRKDNYLTYCLRGASQVFFVGNTLSGILIISAILTAAFMAGSWQVAAGAILGILIATATATILRCDSDSLRAGLYGFNGILVGAALPTFIDPSPVLWLYVAIGSALSVVVTEAFSSTLTKTFGVPGSTGPFVLCGLLLVAGAYSFGHLQINTLSPALTTDYVAGRAAAPGLTELVTIFFKNISQVYLINNAISGALMLIAICIASLRAGVAAACGSVVAIAVAILLGANPQQVANGLYGYSAVLTAMAVGVIFLKPGIWVSLYALLATVVTVFIQGAFDALVQPSGLPAFTAPYVLTMYLFMLPKKALAPHPHATTTRDHPLS